MTSQSNDSTTAAAGATVGGGHERLVGEAFVALADTLVDDHDMIDLLDHLVLQGHLSARPAEMSWAGTCRRRANLRVLRDQHVSVPVVLVELAVGDPRVVVHTGTWRSAAMDASDTQDVTFDRVPVADDAVIGRVGWYTTRPGFTLGGAGVAALWWGGAAGVLDRIAGHLSTKPDAHQLAHLGELHATLEATAALLDRTAAAIDRSRYADHSLAVATLRSAVERAVRDVVDRVPQMVGLLVLRRR